MTLPSQTPFRGGTLNRDEYSRFLNRKDLRVGSSGLGKIPPLRSHLFEFQNHIVRWALDKGRAAIFADCGMGKTIMQLEWASKTQQRTILFAPLAVTRQTEAEACRFGYDARARQTGDDVRSEQIVLTNYERIDSFDLDDFGAVVLDESSILKSYSGKFRQHIIDITRNHQWKLACTATPSPNDFMELGNHAEFLGAMTRAEMLAMFFCHDGGSTQDWRIKGHAQIEFWRWVSSWASMVTKPSDLGYSDEGFILPDLNIHRHVLDYRQEDSDSLFPEFVGMDLSARRSARRGSLDQRCKKAVDLTSAPGQWLLWCELNDESDALAKAIPDAVEVRGSDDPDVKADRLLGFAEGRYRVLITKPKIGGFGMNWQRCHQMAFVGLSDSYESFYQCIRRCWRYGQTSPVDVHIVTSTAEIQVVDNVMRKEANHAEMQRRMMLISRGETQCI